MNNGRAGAQHQVQCFRFCTSPPGLPASSLPWKLGRAPQDQPQTAWGEQQARSLWETGASCLQLWPSWDEIFLAWLLRAPPHLSQAIPTNCSALHMLSVERQDYRYHQYRCYYKKTSSGSQIITEKTGKNRELAADNALCTISREFPRATRSMGCSYKELMKFQSCKVCTFLS